eukprot:365078-Chlamydomonas_euryale.AAC.4
MQCSAASHTYADRYLSPTHTHTHPPLTPRWATYASGIITWCGGPSGVDGVNKVWQRLCGRARRAGPARPAPPGGCRYSQLSDRRPPVHTRVSNLACPAPHRRPHPSFTPGVSRTTPPSTPKP